MSLGTSSPDAVLLGAIRQWATACIGQVVRRISITLADGTKRRFDVTLEPVPTDLWPPPEGWARRGDQAAFNGRVFRIHGKPAAVLAELVAAGDEGVELAELKVAVWDAHTDE